MMLVVAAPSIVNWECLELNFKKKLLNFYYHYFCWYPTAFVKICDIEIVVKTDTSPSGVLFVF